MLAPWKKSYDQPRQHIKNRDITLLTKVYIVKAMVFPVVMCGCESWTIKKAKHWRTDIFELWCWRRLLRVPWTARISNQSILKKSESENRSVTSNSFWPHGLYSPLNSPGQNTGVGSLSLLQGFFQTQGLNPGLQHCRWILYQLSHKGSPKILEWVAYPFSSRSSWPMNWTVVSCIAGRFFANWAMRET